MADWNQKRPHAKRKLSLLGAATGAAWSVLLTTGLCGEAYVQTLGIKFLTAFVPPEYTAPFGQHASVVKISYAVVAGLGAVLTLLWCFQHLSDAVACIRTAKTKDAAQAATKETPSVTAPPSTPPQAMLPMDSHVANGTPASRSQASPYTRSPSAYSNLPPATSPQELMRVQQELTQTLSEAARDGYASPGGVALGLPGSPGTAADWDAGIGRPAAYYSPPPVFHLQHLTGDAGQQTDLPKYHFSLLSLGAATVGTTTALHPSAPRQVADVMRRLRMSRPDLRSCAERLRGWTSERVMRPLLNQMADASRRVTAALQCCQSSNTIVLAPRPLVPQSGDWSELELCSDDEFAQAVMTLQLMLRQQAQGLQAGGLGTPPAQNAAAQEALRSALRAVRDYHMLTKVLRGDFPNKGILGNCSPGYLASRVAAFASDSCCGSFKWQEGGPWGGRPWTRDLPTDTHVLLYLLGAFLAAPYWVFEDTSGLILGAGGPLYVGNVPARRPDAFSAILASKPKKEDLAQMKAALLLLTGAAGEPLILLVMDGKPTVTLCGEWACFEKIVLFLVYIQLELSSKVGPFSLDYLLLDKVLEKPCPDMSVRQRNWFGILT